MEQFRNWILNIMVVVVLSSFAEMIIPEGSFKKYTKLVIGLVVMIVIIKPIIQILGSEMLLYRSTFQTDNYINKMQVVDQSKIIDNKQNQQIINTYHNQLTEEMKQRIKMITGLQSLDVKLDIDTDFNSSGFGSIRSIDVFLQSNTQEGTITVIAPIEPLNISNKERHTEKVGENNPEEELLKIKIINHLQGVYNLPNENIRISFIR